MESSSLISNKLTEELAAQVIRHRLEGTRVADVEAVIQSGLPNEAWEALDGAQQVLVEVQVLKAVKSAARLEHWAVAMGLDGMEPSADAITIEATYGEGTQNERVVPMVRVHLAFHPEMPEENRRPFVLELGEMMNGELG